MKYYVYGYTDRFCQNGFPTCDSAFTSLEAAQAHLANLASIGFTHRNASGALGWIESYPIK